MPSDEPECEVPRPIENAKSVRRRRHFSGLAAERFAAVWLTLKGYWILGTRVRTPAGEIDLIALRGQRLAFVEVKRRQTRADAEASVGPKQRRRVRSAAQLWLARNPRYQNREIAFDIVFLIGASWPVHIRNGL